MFEIVDSALRLLEPVGVSLHDFGGNACPYFTSVIKMLAQIDVSTSLALNLKTAKNGLKNDEHLQEKVFPESIEQ